MILYCGAILAVQHPADVATLYINEHEASSLLP